MGRKKENEEKSTKDDKKAPITTVVKDADGAEYQLRPLNPNTDVDFYKIYLSRFSKTLDGIMNQKMKLVLWLIKKMTLTNELKYSYREIAEQSHISYQTVAETMQTLIEDDFIRRNGKTLMVNPDAVFRGRLDKRIQAQAFYYKIKPAKKNRKKKQKPEQKQEQGKDSEQKQKLEQEQKQEKKLKKVPLSLKDKNDLEWELAELSKEISRLKNWRYNLEFQLYWDENGDEKEDENGDENGELKKIDKDIEKLTDRVKYLSGLLFSAELPEEDDGEDGGTQTEEQKT